MRYCPIGGQGRQSHNSNCGACIANILGLGCCNMECQHCRGYPNTNTKVHKYRDEWKYRYRGVATRWFLHGSPLPPWNVNSGEDLQIQNTNFLQFHSQMSFAIYSILWQFLRGLFLRQRKGNLGCETTQCIDGEMQQSYNTCILETTQCRDGVMQQSHNTCILVRQALPRWQGNFCDSYRLRVIVHKQMHNYRCKSV